MKVYPIGEQPAFRWKPAHDPPSVAIRRSLTLRAYDTRGSEQSEDRELSPEDVNHGAVCCK